MQGFNALRENHQAVASVVFVPAKCTRLQLLQQLLVAAKAVGAGVIDKGEQGFLKLLQASDFDALIVRDSWATLQQGNAPLRGFQGSLGAGEQRFLHANALQLLLAACFVMAALGEANIQQGTVGRFFLGRGALAQAGGDALLEVCRDLVADVFFKAPNYQTLAAEVLRGVVVGV